MIPAESDWTIRRYVYEVLLEGGGAPDAETIAAQFGMMPEKAQAALQRLHEAHALTLDATSGDVLMAHPLSAVPTDYRVEVGDVTLFANCAWDSLGIPAMLSKDAVIELRHSIDREIVSYAVADGQLRDATDGVVHFALPFRSWYDDIVDT